MEKRKLGNSDLMITPVGVGSWAIGGGGWAFAWGPQDDAQSVAAIRAALEAGWNWIDTAAVYGLGHSEEIVARAVAGLSPKPYIFTKCERCWDASGRIQGRLKRDSIRQECEGSLRRLNVDVIDLYQIHWPVRQVPAFGAMYFDPAKDGPCTTIHAQLEALHTLVQTGKTRRMPVILVGSKFWGGLVEWFRNSLLAENMIAPDDMDLIEVIDEPEQVVAAIFKHYETRGFEPSAAEREMQLNL